MPKGFYLINFEKKSLVCWYNIFFTFRTRKQKHLSGPLKQKKLIPRNFFLRKKSITKKGFCFKKSGLFNQMRIPPSQRKIFTFTYRLCSQNENHLFYLDLPDLFTSQTKLSYKLLSICWSLRQDSKTVFGIEEHRLQFSNTESIKT